HGQKCDQLPGWRDISNPEHRQYIAGVWGIQEQELPGPGVDAYEMFRKIDRGEIKGLISICFNPKVSLPDNAFITRCLEKLEFYTAIDFFLNDTAWHADVVLPGSLHEEDEGTVTQVEGRIIKVNKAVNCPGEAREDWRIVIDLARELGAQWPDYGSVEDVWNEFADLAPLWSGIRYDRIDEVGLQWPCVDRDDPGSVYLHSPHPARPNGKGRFFPVEYQPPIETPDSEYPFVLSTGRTLYHYNSATMTMREPGMTDKQEEPFVEVNAEDARALGIGDGDLVRLVSRRGELEARASVGERVHPGLVWMALHFAQAKVNWLTHDVGDPLIGTPEYKVSAVRVELV
ncbi:MAG TPA: molybdopterin dinucleotide binding domain-containing protein, partial [Gaiellaceae bacterium]|nr:molybdopterin dinucleotide binding domain-containing protein [Gaiellaceae bacterium]